MKKYVYSLFLVSSTLVAMEQQQAPKIGMDPALIPTFEECERKRAKSEGYLFSHSALIQTYAEHGDVGAFNEPSWPLNKELDDNKLFSWGVNVGRKTGVVKTLIGRGVPQSIGSVRWKSYISTALGHHDDELATQLLLAKPDVDFSTTHASEIHTLLQMAACVGAIQFARTLLNGKYGAKVDECTTMVAATPLQLAAQGNNNDADSVLSQRKRDIINLLLSHGAKSNVTVTTKFGGNCFALQGEQKQSFIDWCASKKYDDCLAQLVERKELSGTHVLKSDWPGIEQQVSQWAACHGSLPLIRALVPMREEKPAFQEDLTDLIERAANRGHKAVVDYLSTHPYTKKRKSTAQMMMHAAVSKNWLDTARAIVQHYGVSIVTEEDDWYQKMALLHRAGSKASSAMVRQLLAWGCDPHEKDERGNVALSRMVGENKVQTAAVLLAAGNLPDEGNFTALHAAFNGRNTNPEMFEQLLAYTHDRMRVREVCIQQTGMTPVEYAVDRGYRMLKVMLAAGFDPNDFIQEFPLAKATFKVSKKHKEDTKDVKKEGNKRACKASKYVKLLLSYGADPDKVFEDGSTLLHRAARHGSVGLLSTLFNAGLLNLVHKDNSGCMPVVRAVHDNSAEVVAFLLDRSDMQVANQIVYVLESRNDGPDISQTLFEYAVHQVSRSKHMQAVWQLLLERGADLERVNELGETPIFWAARNSNTAALEWLVAHGVRLDVVNHKGETPLSFLACQTEYAQREMLLAVLKGLSESVGGLISVIDALEHSEKWRLNTGSSDEQVAAWKQSMQFDPFERVRAYCGAGLHREYEHLHEAIPTLATRIKELEQKICQHGAYLFGQKMRNAFQSNDIETVRQFIATGIDLRTFDVQHGATILHWAARQGHQDLLVELLQKHGLKEVIDKETVHRCTALSEAANVACAQVLLDNGAAITKNVLFSLMHKESQEVCGLILDKVNADTFTKEDVQIIYDNAVQRGNVLIAQKFLELGAEPSEFDLEHAVLNQHAGIVTLLKLKGISVIRANEAAKERKYSSISSFAAVAVQKKDLALLKEVIETADSGLVTTAAYAGWHEGLAVLLDAGLKDHGAFSGALSAKSYECCKLLINDMPRTLSMLDHALRSTTDCMRLVLDAYKPNQGELDNLLTEAVQNHLPDMVRLLLEHNANPLSLINGPEGCCFNSVAAQACKFGSDVLDESFSWSERVQHIRWLEAWKKARLEGDTSVVLPELKNESIREIIETLYALMVTPRYESAQTHKDAIGQILRSELHPLSVARRWGNSTTFNDLFDPEKVEQWYAAIDREYAAQSMQDQSN